MNATPSGVNLNATDRCDRCPAQAYAVYFQGSCELMFCKHHIKEYNLALEEAGWQVMFDYVGLERLEEEESPVAVLA
jgi:hypothetical protein